MEELDGPATSALGVRMWKLSNVRKVIGWVTKIHYLELLRASEGTLLVPAAFAVVCSHSSFKEG
jgi:hypothetical protein